MVFKKKLNDWKESFRMRKKYSKNHPYCFYDLASTFLPEDENAVLIDIGCGACKFEDHLNLWDKYENLYLLDRNNDTINHLQLKFDQSNIIEYSAPDRIPFDANSVDYIFCGHLIEHLDFKQLYELLKEFDRVLKIGGILVISTPMLWNGFYGTLSHVKPYHPAIFIDYFYEDTEDDQYKPVSYKPISRNYQLEELVFRYEAFVDIHNTWGSSIKIVDFPIQLSKYLLRGLGIKKYTQTGYTIILRK